MATPGFTKRAIGEVVNDTPPGPMNIFSAYVGRTRRR